LIGNFVLNFLLKLSLFCLKSNFQFSSSANAAPEFQGRGGERIASQIVNVLSSLFSTENFDLTQLCIVNGKKCWHLFVDLVVCEIEN